MRTLGEFYREKVLSAQRLKSVTLPEPQGELRIDRSLFGWVLLVDGKTVPCRSNEEARYLRVFCEAGLTEVSVPADDEHLKAILPELENLKSRTDGIVESYLESILDRKLRERLRHEVYAELLK